MQRSPFYQPVLKALLVFILSTLVISRGQAGGDHYRVYLNKTLIAEQYGGALAASLANLPLQNAKPTDQLVFVYSHCGRVGTGRKMVMKNDAGNTVKTWAFANATGDDWGMVIQVKDVKELEKKYAGATLRLYYYAADQLPKGRMLAAVNPGNKALTGAGFTKTFPYVFAAGSLGLLACYPLVRRRKQTH